MKKETPKINEQDSIILEANYLVKLAMGYSNKKRYHQALKNFEKALDLYEKANDYENMTKSLVTIGNIYFFVNNDQTKAVECFEKALPIYDKMDDKRRKAGTLVNIGNIFYNTGTLEKAVDYYEKAFSISEEINDKEGLSKTGFNIGFIHHYRRDFDKAIEYYDKVLIVYEELKDFRNIADCFSSLGNIYAQKGNYEKALDYSKKALSNYEKTDFKQGIALSNVNIGILCTYKSDYNSAERYNDISLKNFKKEKNLQGEAFVFCNMGNLHYQKQEYEKAIEYYQKSIDIRIQINERDVLGHNYSYLVCTYSKLGKYKEALDIALLHFKDIEIFKEDIKHGRTHLGVAITLAHLSEDKTIETKQILEEITKLTNLPETPEAYFEKAIEISTNDFYYETQIPAIFEYGKYLYEKGMKDEGLDKINQAKEKAQNIDLLCELEKIITFCSKIDLPQ